MNRIQLEDNVIIISGKNKGYIGKVKKIIGYKVLIDGANLVQKAIKPNPKKNINGGLIKYESYIHISNVALYIQNNEDNYKKSKIGFKYIVQDTGKKLKVRFDKKTKKVIEKK